MMAVSLYTSRVVLNALGVEDFGIYNVVGGVVTMFSIISGSLSAAISRFITFELGKGDEQKLKRVFSSSVTIQIFLSFILILLIEFIGVWFLNEKMNIPTNRITAANWVLQLSIVTFVVNLISVQYNAAIIAHERMSAFAYISIIEAVGKLIIAFLINTSTLDKLIFYAILMSCVAIIIRSIYGYYCKKHFIECVYNFNWDKEVLKKIFNFAGWNFLGAGSSLLMTQGVNILIYMFFGVTLNAINPQITKSYASDNLEYMHKLVCIGSKYSFFLTWFFVLPILLETDIILKIWLKNVPEYASTFLRLTLCISLVSVISNTLVTSMLATGNIKRYQLIVGGLGMCVFPMVYIAYKTGLPVESAYIIHLLIFIIQLLCRLYLLRGMIKLQIRYFWNNTLVNDIKVALLSSVPPIIIFILMPDSILKLMTIIIVCIISILSVIYLFGMTRNEKEIIKTYIIKVKERF